MLRIPHPTRKCERSAKKKPGSGCSVLCSSETRCVQTLLSLSLSLSSAWIRCGPVERCGADSRAGEVSLLSPARTHSQWERGVCSHHVGPDVERTKLRTLDAFRRVSPARETRGCPSPRMWWSRDHVKQRVMGRFRERFPACAQHLGPSYKVNTCLMAWNQSTGNAAAAATFGGHGQQHVKSTR